MKKFWIIISAITMTLALSACAGNAEEKTAKEEEAAGPTKEEVQKSLVKFYMGLEKEINAVDVDLNTYEGAEEPDAEQKAKASESAAATAAKVKEVEIPAELKDQKADIEAALEDISASYQAKADELKKDAPALDTANETFTQGEEKLGKVFEDLELLKPSLAKSVS
nr:hypothetical protein [Neobacillus sp. Marseille-Q6967]